MATIGAGARIVQPTAKTFTAQARLSRANERTVTVKAKIISLFTSDTLSGSFLVQREETRRIRVYFWVDNGYDSTQRSIGARARIASHGRRGLPGWFMVNMEREDVENVVFGYSVRTDRSMAVGARIIK